MLDAVQGSEAWHQARLGKVTASRVAHVIARTKSGYAASRTNYEAELICERLTGQPAEKFRSAAMEWGTETEAQARAAYAFMNDADVIEVGFIPHPSIEMAGASPDGIIGDDGLVEIKCPNTATHLDTLLTAKVPGRYITQMQWQMACTGRRWCDFVSFDPRLPANLRLFVQRIERDADAIAEMEGEVRAFLTGVEAKIERLREVAA